MTEDEFRRLYAGHLYAYRGGRFVAIVQLFRDGRVRFTDFLPGGVETGYLKLRTSDPQEAARIVARYNGLELYEAPKGPHNEKVEV